MKSSMKYGYLGAAVLLLATTGLILPLNGQNSGLPIPTGTRMVIELDTPISSKTSQIGDPFEATVISPSEYASAIIHGSIRNLRESGRVEGRTEINLDFDSIRLDSGRSAPFEAELIELRQNESVKVVDEEGNIQSGSRGKEAIKRGAIGAAIGGVLGGIIGGGKGALIGILAGGGVGAGSLVIEGAEELRLEPGAELEIETIPAPSRSGTSYNRNLVRDVQRALNERGYDAGAADGRMGTQTKSALMRFQRDENLRATGEIDEQTAERLGVSMMSRR